MSQSMSQSTNQYAVIIVYSTSHAMQIEKLLQEKEIACKLIPVPRHISSDCGVCIRVRRANIEVARQTVADAAIEIDDIYEI